MRFQVNGHLRLFHRFEQRALRFRRGAVYFVGQHDVGEKRAFAEELARENALLDAKAKQLDLQKRINEKLTDASELEARGQGTQAMSKRMEAAALNSELFGMSGKEGRIPIPGLDSLGQSGGMTGGSVNFDPAAYEQAQTNQILSDVRDNTRRIAEKIENPVSGAKMSRMYGGSGGDPGGGFEP